MQRSLLTFANIAQRVYPTRKAWMVTLTYRENGMWHAKHIAEALNAMRTWASRNNVRVVYEWVMELTKQGRPHYHVVVWLPRHLEVPKFDTRGWWPHGMSQRIRARFAPGYLAKYVSKGVKQWDASNEAAPSGWDEETQQARGLPKRARMHGTGGLTGVDRVELRWHLMPRWVRESIKWMGTAQRTKGGWTCKQTGEFFPSPFEVTFSHGTAWFRRKSPASCTLPERTRPSDAANASSFATCSWA